MSGAIDGRQALSEALPDILEPVSARPYMREALARGLEGYETLLGLVVRGEHQRVIEILRDCRDHCRAGIAELDKPLH
jgi:hypothetical protein